MRKYPVTEEYLERVLNALRGNVNRNEMNSIKNSTRAYINRCKSQKKTRVVYYNTPD